MRPSQAVRDMQGRVNLDSLSEGDLDYGSELKGLAKLRRRMTRVLFKFNGDILLVQIHLLSLPNPPMFYKKAAVRIACMGLLK